MAVIKRFCVLEEEHNGDNVFLIHRPYIFGNPYTHIKNKETKALVTVKDREEAIRLYEPYFDKMLEYDENFKKEWEKLVNAYHNYDEIYIGCYCSLKETCHANIIIKKLNQYILKEYLKKLKNNKK